jgi:hypothetical protein
MSFHNVETVLLLQLNQGVKFEVDCRKGTEEYQDGKNSYCEFFGLVPFLQLAIHIVYTRKN